MKTKEALEALEASKEQAADPNPHIEMPPDLSEEDEALLGQIHSELGKQRKQREQHQDQPK